MTARPPLAVSEKNAAAMLDMPPAKFRDLVQRGILPQPRRLGDIERWDVAELQAVLRGEGAGMDGVKW